MNITVFVDHSNPLNGVLSWINDLTEYSPDLDLLMVGMLTQDERTPWAETVDQDILGTLVRLSPEQVKVAENAQSLDELSADISSIIQRTDVYLPNGYESGYRLAALARRLHHPNGVVAFTHTDAPHDHYLTKRYADIVSTFVAADSPSLRRTRERLPDRVSSIVQVPHGLTAPPFEARQPSEEHLALVYAGRVIQEQKRIFDLLPMCAELRRRGVRFTLDVIGDGADREAFQHRAALRYPEIRCRGLMRRQDLLATYQHYDCLVMCSQTEGMSVALMEAMARGVVPVVTDVGGAKDLIAQGREGYTWPPGETARAADHLERLWKDPALLAACSRAAHHTIATRHAPATAAARMTAILRNAAAHPVGSPAQVEALLADTSRSPYLART
ncbi:glycosyltransferase family 4 protein (plasmid) [Streptomyces sp. CA-142005]|uniref:glycosyltransferase family 4 protein n=1 Tax=Streptomyces sp. CA-142005 TaxID=3240052 RepID=UPI003D90F5DF